MHRHAVEQGVGHCAPFGGHLAKYHSLNGIHRFENQPGREHQVGLACHHGGRHRLTVWVITGPASSLISGNPQEVQTYANDHDAAGPLDERRPAAQRLQLLERTGEGAQVGFRQLIRQAGPR
jgi:hypothetical protein